MYLFAFTDNCPQDYDKPEHIADPDAEKPEDWDDDVDGEWEAPMIDNPDFKVWKRARVCCKSNTLTPEQVQQRLFYLVLLLTYQGKP